MKNKEQEITDLIWQTGYDCCKENMQKEIDELKDQIEKLIQWNNVKDSLPDEEKLVLLKINNDVRKVGLYRKGEWLELCDHRNTDGGFVGWAKRLDNDLYTHWRYIKN